MKLKAKLIMHRGESRIALPVDSARDHFDNIRNVEGSRWSQTNKCWHLPDTPANRQRYDIKVPVVHQPSPEASDKIEKFRNWLLSRRYSDSTIGTYTGAVKSFMTYYHHKDSNAISNEDVIGYNNQYILARKLSASFQNQVVNALKLYFLIIEEKIIDPSLIHRPKSTKVLPNVLSKLEVRQILDAPRNLKHRVMLSLIYACGLRRGELLNLVFTDIHSDRHLLIIRQAKGNKDRIVPLSDKVLGMLRDYYKTYRPAKWLFEGQQVGEPYSSQALQQVLKMALKRTTIAKPVTLHWLRHSYATHLLESGTDLRYIQELLGHNSSRTTEIYTHVSTKSIQNIKSPFDDL